MDELVLIGKTVSTHGIKGELKIISNFEYQNKAFIVNNTVMINNINHKITSIRYHKQYILMRIDFKENINDVLEYVGYNIYIKRSDLKLNEKEYLLKDLYGLNVLEDEKILGKVKEVIIGNPNNYIKVSGQKEFLIPLIDNYIIEISNKNIKTKNAKDLMF